MKTILNPSLLDEFCLSCVESSVRHPLYFHYLKFLYNTGCRPSEPLTPNVFISRNDQHVVIQPKKKNNLRFISIDFLEPSIFDINNDNRSHLSMMDYQNILHYFQKIKPKTYTTTDNKSTQLYLFRYNYVNQLFLDGKSKEEITNIMGWKLDTIVDRYLNTEIYINY